MLDILDDMQSDTCALDLALNDVFVDAAVLCGGGQLAAIFVYVSESCLSHIHTCTCVMSRSGGHNA